MAELVKFEKYLESVKGETREGIGAIEGGQYQYLFISTEEEKAIKKRDVWILDKVTHTSIVARNKITREKVSIPRTALCRGLRRISGFSKIDVSQALDYIVVDSFPDINKFFSLFSGKKRGSEFMEMWKKHVTNMLGHLTLMRRFDISATGSMLLTFYSSVPMAPTGLMWSIRIPNKDAKYLALWLNSTPNILQVMKDRKETRGAFMQIDEYTLDDLLVLNPQSLGSTDRTLLAKTFNKIKDYAFPSILEQLSGRDKARQLMDRAILKVLGFSSSKIEKKIEFLYPSLVAEISRLKTLMGGSH